MPILLVFKELLGFGETAADKTDTNGQTSGDPEDGFPGLDGTADAEVGASGKDVAHGVALL